ncbi:MAG: phage tail protein [Deltaproteobacteria bacterium]|nr:phage tail protein [Deltaproteobacteria bacterium]MCW5807447.1 phage tail protein [Deltaproteobacteria bacterium]
MDGDRTGLFRSIEGGSIKTDVMTYQHGANYDRWRQLGKPKYEDIKLQIGMSMTRPFYAWIRDFFTGVATRKTGAICAADFDYKERARREFKDALIKELTFPKLDGQDKAAAYMTVALAVEDIVFKPGDNNKLPVGGGFANQKIWTANNFRLKVDGFDCSHVSKVDSFTIKQNIIEYHTGSQRAPIKTPSQVDFPNIVFYVPESKADEFITHFNKRGVRGELPGRLTGMIQMFDQGKADTFTLAFRGADFLSITPDKADATSEDIKQVKVEMYVEQMTFKYHQAG